MQRSRKNLRVGVVGVGYLGKFHAEKYAAMNDVDLVGVVDVENVQAEEIARRLHTKAYRDYRDLLGKVDAVSIVIPTPLHFEVTKKFLANNVDVLIEKPMTAILKEADELIALAESRGLIVQVGLLERFNPAVVAAKEFVHRPMLIEARRLCIYNERGTDVSVVMDLMIHDIDIVLNLVRSEVTDIRAAGIAVVSEDVDFANARLEFENGCVANLTADRISMKNEREIRLFQKDAIITIDYAKRGITVVQPDPGSDHAVIPGRDIRQRSFTDGDALKDELASFVAAVKKRQTPEVTGRMGRDALGIAFRIMEQIERSGSHWPDS